MECDSYTFYLNYLLYLAMITPTKATVSKAMALLTHLSAYLRWVILCLTLIYKIVIMLHEWGSDSFKFTFIC